MFTGIIEEVGKVLSLVESGGKKRLTVSSTQLVRELKKGGSIAVSGVCLTAVDIKHDNFTADLAHETVARTSLSRLAPNAVVNLELPTRADGRLGGHIVQGHVDGVGEVRSAVADGFARRVRVAVPDGLERYLVEHGSITMAGVSLTVAGLESDWFEVSLIPETLERTTLGGLQDGARVNLELDVVARYVERLLGFKEKGE